MNNDKPTILKEKLSWQDAIRKRPGMYIGLVNHKGYVDTLKKIITEIIYLSGCDTVRLSFIDKLEGEIEFDNIRKELRQDISVVNQLNPHLFYLPVLNGLSKWMQITFDGDNNIRQEFKNGETETEPARDAIKCEKLRIAYSLDESVWGKEFSWNTNYLSYELREFCYLNPTVKFEITEKIENFSNTNTYEFRNGLSDRLEIEMLNGMGTCYFKHHFIHETEHFKLDAAFAFRQYSVDQTFIRTYVNNEITAENGSHLDGLLKGLTNGVMKYFQANDLVNDFKISEKGIQQGLVCIMNLTIENAEFSGCVRNKLANAEIIKPIANYVSGLLFKSIRADKESTEKLIDKFKIGRI